MGHFDSPIELAMFLAVQTGLPTSEIEQVADGVFAFGVSGWPNNEEWYYSVVASKGMVEVCPQHGSVALTAFGCAVHVDVHEAGSVERLVAAFEKIRDLHMPPAVGPKPAKSPH